MATTRLPAMISSCSVLVVPGRLSAEKTRVCHIDEGFDFLGYRIQRRSWRGRPGKRAVYTYPSKKALASVMAKVRSLTRRKKHQTPAALLRQLNPVLRGWCTYFRHGVSSRTFGGVGSGELRGVRQWPFLARGSIMA